MNVLKHELSLWRRARQQKGITLQRRLIAFFALVVVCVILSFTLLLMLFGVTGSGRQTLYRYLESELLHVSQAAQQDLGELSVIGIHMAEQLAEDGARVADDAGLPLRTLLESRDERLLSAQMATLLSVAGQNPCGGVFLVLDTPGGGEKYPGIFLKKTQPVSSASLQAQIYSLRGSADIARKHGVELLAQWQMDYDSGELPFLDRVLTLSRAHADLPLSRLYYWSGRLRLNGNSEAGILLCLPLRGEAGDVYGVCGIEVSDRMFKQLYSPGESAYHSVFSLAAPAQEGALLAQNGLIAGNRYLTGSQMTEPLVSAGTQREFSLYTGQRDTYGGLFCPLKLYPTGSPYEDECWVMAVLLPKALLEEAIRGRSAALLAAVAVLLVISLVLCVLLSRRYLRPIQQGLTSIRRRAYENEPGDFGVVEIDALFADLAREIRAHQDEVEALRAEHRDARAQMELTRIRMDRLADQKRQEIDPEAFALFLDNVERLTVTERRIFDLYLEGRTPKEILELTHIKENTLKYHNRNIYSKLGVASRKQLLQFAALTDPLGETASSG